MEAIGLTIDAPAAYSTQKMTYRELKKDLDRIYRMDRIICSGELRWNRRLTQINAD
jgi:hypothetical protein